MLPLLKKRVVLRENVQFVLKLLKMFLTIVISRAIFKGKCIFLSNSNSNNNKSRKKGIFMLKRVIFGLALTFAVYLGAAELKLDDGWVVSYSAKGYKVTRIDGGFIAKCVRSGGYLEVTKTVNFPVRSRLHFTADVESEAAGAVQLWIYREEVIHGKTRLWQSRINFAPADKLIAETDVRDENPTRLVCRINPVVGKEYKITNLKCFTPSGSGDIKLEITPGYASVAYELSDLASAVAEDFKAEVSFREVGKDYCKAYKADFPPLEHKARGVLVNLKEDTEYEFQIKLSDKGNEKVITRKFRTLGKALPVAKTVYLTPEMVKKGFVVPASGTADGYIRYTAKPGTILTSDGLDAIKVFDVNYIIIDGLTIRGGKENGIRIECASNIVVRNCDISGFGRVGVQRTERGGEFYVRPGGKGKERILNSDAGVYIRNAKDLLIEKNFIHDTAAFTNPWFYSHPAGPKAINVGMAANTTIRYNDFIGGDMHRWNDAVECQGNSSPVGGLYRNAEIYGNILALTNDDGIELEGGEINTRFFGNRVENTLCGVSSGSCTRGPSYIFNNLFWRSGDVNGLSVAAFKNGHGVWGSGKVHIFNNTAIGFRGGIHPPGVDTYRTRLDKMEFFNNIFSLGSVGGAKGLFTVAKSVSDYNFHNTAGGLSIEEYRKTYNQEKHTLSGDPKYTSAADGIFTLASGSPAIGAGRVIDNFTAAGSVDMGAFQSSNVQPLPLRDLDFVTSVQAVDFAFGDTAPRKIRLTATGKNVCIPFTIARTFEAEWLKVTPEKGVIESGKPVTLTVSVVPEKFRTARINNTVFLVRTPDGSSRPVTVSADTTRCEKLLKENRKNVLFAEVKNGKRTTEASFDVKKPGYYFLMLYGPSCKGNANIYLNGKKIYKAKISHSYQGLNKPAGTKYYFNLSQRQNKNVPVKLQAGKNSFKIVYDVNYTPDAAALISNSDEIMQATWVR